MTVPSTFVHASRDLERFLLDARDELSHATTHQTWQSVLAAGNPSPLGGEGGSAQR